MGGCPVHNSDSESANNHDEADASDSVKAGKEKRRGRVGRRDFVKSALLIGGAAAVSTLGGAVGATPTVREEDERSITAAARLNRQHAWDAFEPTVPSGNSLHPENTVILLLDYQHDGEPSPGHRKQVDEALRELERTFAWRPEGMMFTMAYSSSYFDRFEEDPPAGAAPDDAASVVDTIEELSELAETNDDVTPDDYDAVLLLSSANEVNLLAAEAALWGEGELEFSATFEGVFEKPEAWPERRVGFGGPAFQEREAEYEESFLDDDQEIPDEAPLSMGFVAGFGASIPEEEIVTLKRGQEFPGPGLADDVPDLDYVDDGENRDPGMFAQGTLKHLSHLEIDLESWYDRDEDRRRHQMYSPYHTEAETNAKGGDKPGSGLAADDDGPDDGPDQNEYTTLEYADRTEQTASGDEEAETSEPTAGHSQKTARARYDVDGDGEPEQPVLRRDWDAISLSGPDGGQRPGYIFNVPMRFNESIYSLLDATYNIEFQSLDGNIDHDAVGGDEIKERSGIAPSMDALRRGNWLVPPITLRALPYPQATEATISVADHGETVTVEVSDVGQGGGTLDPETVQFGEIETVNTARGASPKAVLGNSSPRTFESVAQRGQSITFEFDSADIDVSPGDTVKLFGKKRGNRKPVVGITDY